ncbi:LacI family DNA-binding transcriptional regulator [Lachnospiraceae bacterium OttesenSCG-928-D06]|nr:LacI family DNA-binding transcriptional regulator [Lachnospiraceae bacterium OttesenSCG-928-D06]
MKQDNAPTMKDVAKEAGVALGTVSKVINGIPVGEEYRKKVENAIQKLNYEVNTYARGLKVNKSNIVTLIIPDSINPFNAVFIHYIESALYEHRKFLTLCCSNGIVEKEVEYLNMAIQNQADGVIALTYSDIGKHVSRNLPLVSFDRQFDNGFTPRIASDNFTGGVMATEKLIELGCKQPIFIRFSSSIVGEADKRLDGYLHACEKHNISPILLDKRTDADSYQCISEFIQANRGEDGSLTFDGIFANTDYHAHQACKILKNMGYLIPEEVQVIGFDGIHKFGFEHNELFVSTICQPIDALAKTCVDMVLKKDRSMLPSLTLLPVTYQYGGTTKA